MMQTIRHILDTFPEKFRKLGYETDDVKTGINDGSVKLSQFNEYYTYLSEENYYLTLEEVKEQQTQFTNKKENMLLGLVGALMGASLSALL
ncbi:hypothetical protein ACTQ45_00160 [Fundicoccus sp. Sow4_D5]|uniref:hypothetical protein n=1 Tax=Fundicoccus sp. Sow4_D5 TaxID=3438782 RepID=UPI003F8EEECB